MLQTRAGLVPFETVERCFRAGLVSVNDIVSGGRNTGAKRLANTFTQKRSDAGADLVDVIRESADEVAGSFFAKGSHIYVLRTNPDGTQKRIPFNYKDVIKGTNPEQNIKLLAGDTLVVP